MPAAFVQTLVRLATQAGPRVLPAVKAAAPLIAQNPQTGARAKSLVDDVLRARRARSRPERLRRTIEQLHTEALRQQGATSDPEIKERSVEWVRRLDSLAGAVALLEARRGAHRSEAVHDIEQHVDELFAEIFTAAVEDGGR